MTHVLFFLFLVGLSPILVSAHGYVGKVTIDGTDYDGPQPGASNTAPSIIRQVSHCT